MRGSTCRCTLLALGLTLAAARLWAQEGNDERWMRDCQRDSDDRRVRHCEVRHAGFHPGSADLTIDPDENGGVEIAGWDRDSVAVAIHIQTGAASEADARALADEVEVTAAGSTVQVRGPRSGPRESWSVSLVLMVPRKSGLRVEGENGPLSVEGVGGSMELRCQNGPVSLIGLSGDVHARVTNGPLTVVLAGSRWEGRGLDAEAVNGPVDLSLPDGYNAELETGTVNGPMETSVPLTVTLLGRSRDRIHSTLGKGGPQVRIVTTNGPLTIRRARS
jgi:Toastrack DUF4097